MQRRVILQGILYLAVACLYKQGITVARARGPLPPFCSLRLGAIASERISQTTGDHVLDSQLPAELFRVSDIFEIMPGFGIIDGENAHAMPESPIDNTKGTVLFGRILLLDELRKWGSIAIAGIMAHECGHILQYFSGLYSILIDHQSTQRLAELHADYMAGYYLGVKRLSTPMDITAFLDSLYSKGDTDFSNERHHGTASNRKDAMLAGYQLGLRGRSDLNDVAQHAVNAVRAITL
jgi:hypothetical protein